jgi:hypothetical protein
MRILRIQDSSFREHLYLTSMEPCIANVFLSTTNEMQRYTVFFIVVCALYVSSGFSAHHQELKNCICSIGTCQMCVLLLL